MFIYNNNTGLIHINKNVIDTILYGNISNFLDENKYLEEFFKQELIFDNITKHINIKLNLTVVKAIKSSQGKWPRT